MNITLKAAQPEPVTVEKLIVNGVEIGKLEFNPDRKGYPYHVIINAKDSEGGGLYQGHGETPEEALHQTLDRHRMYANAQIGRLDALESAIFGNNGNAAVAIEGLPA